MSGVFWAAAAGLVFGLFQAVNRASLLELDVYESTFIQLLASLVVLVAFVVGTGEFRRLVQVPPEAYLYFALSGLIHFFGGWTLLNQSQKLLGAARTSPLLASTPLFGTLLAFVTLGELPGLLPLIGMAAIVGGVTIVHVERVRRETAGAGGFVRTDRSEKEKKRSPFLSSIFGLGAAFAWSVSPIFIRQGLRSFDAPLIGVTIGVFAATLVFGLVLLVRRRPVLGHLVGRRALLLKLVAGVLVGLATWSRWYALSLTEVTIVLSLGLLSVPTVMLTARLFAGKELERITLPVVGGAALVVAGALILIIPRVGGQT